MESRRNVLKKFGIMVIALGMLVGMTGFAMADPGVNGVFETQGVTIVTSIICEGNMQSSTDVHWEQSSSTPLTAIPGAPTSGDFYVATYSEDTMSNGVGFINYDKTLNLDTKERVNGEYNIEATKEIAFIGVDGAEITSTDHIFLDGTGEYSTTADEAICVFASDKSTTIPRFCNTVEAGSSFTMEVVNARTETNARFVTMAADYPVAVNHNIRVDKLADLPSVGKVSAFMEGIIMEGRGTCGSAFEEVEFSESTMADGYITLFDKVMGWESGIKRV
jgi:hypothetical protein